MVTLRAALGIGEREVVAFVGGGGKTTAMLRLARELRDAGAGVMITTTTKIFPPEEGADLEIVIDPARSTLVAFAGGILSRGRTPVAARATTADRKLAGIPPEWVADLAALPLATHVLVEADGAARKPIKAPREGEPVIPSCATIVVAVVGLDALGERLGDVAHRPERLMAITGLAAHERLDARAVARVLLDTTGIANGAPPGARIVPLLNKADDPRRVVHGHEVAAELRRRGARRVVVAALDARDAVVELHAEDP